MASELEIMDDMRKLGEFNEKVGNHLKAIGFSYKRLKDDLAFAEDKRRMALNELESIKTAIEVSKDEAKQIIAEAQAKAKDIQGDIARRMVEVQRLENEAKRETDELKVQKRQYEKLVKALQPA